MNISLHDLKRFLLENQVYVEFGNRIPKDYFWSSGTGESDYAIHAGSFHLALEEAGIHRYNVIPYSSIMSAAGTEIERPRYVHGEVLEGIIAVESIDTAEKLKRITAGIILGWLYDKKNGERRGGLACEYHGSFDEESARNLLKKNLMEIYIGGLREDKNGLRKTNGFKDKYDMDFDNARIEIKSFLPEGRYGTTLVAIGFNNYLSRIKNIYPAKGLSDLLELDT